MSFVEKRDAKGVPTKATKRFGIQKEICFTPFRGKTYVHISDIGRNKCVSMSAKEFYELTTVMDDLNRYHNMFHPSMMYEPLTPPKAAVSSSNLLQGIKTSQLMTSQHLQQTPQHCEQTTQHYQIVAQQQQQQQQQQETSPPYVTLYERNGNGGAEGELLDGNEGAEGGLLHGNEEQFYAIPITLPQ